MKILITGSSGQLGHALQEGLEHHEVIPLGDDDIDITRLDQVRKLTRRHTPDVVINAAKLKAHNFISTLSLKNLIGVTIPNTMTQYPSSYIWDRVAHYKSGFVGAEYSFANDVAWRDVSDLNEVMLYFNGPDHELKATQQRPYLCVIDGIDGAEKVRDGDEQG